MSRPLARPKAPSLLRLFSALRVGVAMVLVGSLATSNLACDGSDSPLIEALVPASGQVGTTVDVIGERFGDESGFVAFGGVPTRAILWQPQRVRVEVPAVRGGLVPVVITVDGRRSLPVDFTVLDH